MHTLIILDWDDTLFPTSWVGKRDVSGYNFTMLDLAVHKLLTMCMKLGETVIVTNASSKWVEQSSKQMKYTNKLLQEIHVLSAREAYEEKTDMSEWKRKLFYDLYHHVYPKKNIISIGDAEYEYNACINLHPHVDNARLKTIKLLPNPSHQQVVHQVENLTKAIHKIVEHPQHLDLLFTSV